MDSIVTILKVKKVKSKDDLEALLTSLGDLDADYSGENGEDYLSEEALEAGFESDAAYDAHRLVAALDEASFGAATVKEAAERYCADWLGQDGYYHEYCVDVERAGGGKGFPGTYAASIAATVG